MPLDWSLRAAFLVMAGGAVGSLARWSVGLLLNRGGFPWGTLAVNVLGSFLIGLLVFVGAPRTWIDTDGRLLLATGLLGGFTTMSAFALESVVLVDEGQGLRAGGYVLLTVAACLAAAAAGRWLARALV